MIKSGRKTSITMDRSTLLQKACKHEISRTTHWIYFICNTQVAHGPQMCPINFGDDAMRINEWAGLM